MWCTEAASKSVIPRLSPLQVSKLKTCMETCAALLEFHHHCRHGTTNVTVATSDGYELAYHRLVYLGVASLLSHLLDLVPHDKVCGLRLDGVGQWDE